MGRQLRQDGRISRGRQTARPVNQKDLCFTGTVVTCLAHDLVRQALPADHVVIHLSRTQLFLKTPRMWFRWCLPSILLLGSPSVTRAETSNGSVEPGEVVIRDVVAMTVLERGRLMRLIGRSAEAKVLLEAKRREVAAFATSEPRPLAMIAYEGRLNTDPERIAAVRHLQDMDNTAALFELWQATGDADLAQRCRLFIQRWASVYVPNGNDVNENKLMPLLVAYEALRPGFDVEARSQIDAWVRRLATLHLPKVRDHRGATGNRYAKRLRLVMTAGLILDQPEWIAEAIAGFRALVERALFADGTSHDLRERDTLTYHTTTLRPLLDLALLTRRRGEDLYAWQAPGGGSLKKSVDYVRPYATGEKTRKEWVNSTVEIDRQRAAAGIAHYQPGSLYDPQQSISLLEQAELFDAPLGPIVAKLYGRPDVRFPSWRIVVNAALRG